ncbi:MAG: UDP-2,3-diacylglucosamine diphosphatase [candidate division Zixibacteria bacterium]|nr:UDP-2,3-diacylglucosamine diphosphatase [candidate division Zixibacteria bacterium]
MHKPIYFISDAHLGAEEKEIEKIKEERLLAFLDKVKEDGESLYILGDMFEFWFEYNDLIPKDHFKILSQLRNVVDSGIKVSYVVGNHDFWLGDFLTGQMGIKIFKEEVEVNHQDKKIFIAHGDGLAKKDFGYRILKKILRSRVNIFLYKQLPPDLSYPLAKFVAGKSRAQADKREASYVEDYKSFAYEKIRQGFDAVILAHTHIPTLENLTYGSPNSPQRGIYLNIGDWFKHFTYGKLLEGKFYLEKFV